MVPEYDGVFNRALSAEFEKAPNEFNLKAELYGEVLFETKINSQNHQLETISQLKRIPRFELRMMKKLDEENSSEAREFLEIWKSKPNLLSLASADKSDYHIDLHTHFAGAPAGRSLFRIAEKLEIPFPTSLLDELKIRYKSWQVYEEDGISMIKFHRSWAQAFLRHLDINPIKTVSFEDMELIYKIRNPIVKSLEAFPLLLEELAKDYSRQGVKYAELSFYTIVKPEFYKIANELLPALEEKYGVRMNFLVGMWRHSDSNANSEAIQETRDAMKECPYVVGVDFMGHETNPTLDFKEAMDDLAKLKNDVGNMEIRVHAGENSNHSDNVIDAIRLGATRVGHGIYGVTDEAIQLAKEKGVIIEFNFNSNLALQNVEGPIGLAASAKKYLDGQVRVTLGTDGHGLYSTTAQSELAISKSLGFSAADIKNLSLSNKHYVDRMNGLQKNHPEWGRESNRPTFTCSDLLTP